MCAHQGFSKYNLKGNQHQLSVICKVYRLPERSVFLVPFLSAFIFQTHH